MLKNITIIGSGNDGATVALWSVPKELGDIVRFIRTKDSPKGTPLTSRKPHCWKASIWRSRAPIGTTTPRSPMLWRSRLGCRASPGMSREGLLNRNSAGVGGR